MKTTVLFLFVLILGLSTQTYGANIADTIAVKHTLFKDVFLKDGKEIAPTAAFTKFGAQKRYTEYKQHNTASSLYLLTGAIAAVVVVISLPVIWLIVPILLFISAILYGISAHGKLQDAIKEQNS